MQSTINFFFFQAEDGIRDSSVTGVQTCALPISPLDLHVAHVERGLLRDDAALLGPARALVRHLRVLLDHVHTLDNDLLPRGVGRDDLPLPAAVLARVDHDAVPLLDLHLGWLRRRGVPRLLRHHNPSGASEMMRMKRFSRSSRPTGPKMRVPRGSPPSLISTAAFSSKRM